MKPSTIRIGRRYRSNRLEGPYDTIVIGSGPGGMAAAVCLSKAGQKVLVLEQHYTAGGFSHRYSRNGYEWDVGVHYVGDVGNPKTMAGALFGYLTDGELQWSPMADNYDRFYLGEDQYDLIRGKDAFRKQMVQYFPDETDAIDQYLSLLKQVSNAMPAFSARKLLPGWMNKVMRLAGKGKLPSFFNEPTVDVLSRLTSNKKLIAVLTGQWGDNGLPPEQSSFMVHALIARHYMFGGYYPIGGASRIAETMIPQIQASGGELFTYAEVAEILIENGRAVGVKMKDGTDIRAQRVISNAGVFNTFSRLLPESTARATGYLDKLNQVTPSMTHLGMYIGIADTAENLDLPKTNFWIYQDEHHGQNVDRFLKDSDHPFPVVYISFPSAKDASWDERYPNRATIEIVAPAKYEWFEQWKDETWGKRGEDYDALKEGFSERLLEVLYEKLPQLRGKVDYYELSTPLSTDFFCFYKKGEIYGLSHDPNRFNQHWLKPKTDIAGLYLTGQDVMTAGVVGAAMSGLMTAGSVLGLVGGWKMLKQVQSWKPEQQKPLTVVSENREEETEAAV
ncbi:phytoene desaturase family protein [Endozoicomonas atrinae]|uniref:phytoene desaturase family protein n=1 Tax=Endozoicomonas atrinae TaxID=1333660 RepID=UPI003AFF7452